MRADDRTALPEAGTLSWETDSCDSASLLLSSLLSSMLSLGHTACARLWLPLGWVDF